MIWAKIVIAWCAAYCVRYCSQLLTEQLWHRGEACQFQRDSSGQIYKFNVPRYRQQQLKSQRTNRPIPEHMDVVAHRALFLPPLSAASGASPAAEGLKSAHSDAQLSRSVSQQRTSSAPNLLASISAVRNSLNSSSALMNMLHEIT